MPVYFLMYNKTHLQCSVAPPTYPLVRHYLDEVVRREWLKYWHKEVDHMLISSIFATIQIIYIKILIPTSKPFEQEILMM